MISEKEVEQVVLCIGCGQTTAAPGVIRLDISEEIKPDVVWDLDNFPYPFEDNKFDAVECFDVIEHLNNIPKSLQEIHRILKNNGVLKITTPHYSCANSYIDPTHRYHLSYFSFDYFCEGHQLSYYSKARYRIKNRRIQFQGSSIVSSLLNKLANKFPYIYEQRWAWIFPAWFLYFELEAVKDITK